MSTEHKALDSAPTRWAKPKPVIERPGNIETPAVDQIDVDSLQIDEFYEVDCDPYNSTGQHLVDTLKKRYED